MGLFLGVTVGSHLFLSNGDRYVGASWGCLKGHQDPFEAERDGEIIKEKRRKGLIFALRGETLGFLRVETENWVLSGYNGSSEGPTRVTSGESSLYAVMRRYLSEFLSLFSEGPKG